jgi:hypothetical protein
METFDKNILMKPRHYISLYLLSSLCLIIAGCEIEPFGDDNIIKDSLTIQEEFQLNFSLENFDDPSGHIVENIEVNWANYKTKIYAEKEWYEFEVMQRKPITYKGNGEIQGQFFTLLAHKNEDGIKYYINKMLSFQNGKGYTHFNIEEKYYGGMVYLYNLQGEVEHLFHFEKGVPLHSVESTKVKSETTNSLGLVSRGDCHQKGNTARCTDALSCGIRVGSGGSSNGGTGSCGSAAGGGTGWTPVTTYHYTDWYNNRGSHSEYSHTEYNGSSTEWVWISGGSQTYNYSNTSTNYASGSTNPDGYTSGVTYSDNPPNNVVGNTMPIVFDNSIKSNPCLKRIMKKLGSKDKHLSMVPDINDLQGVGHLSQGILDLFKSSSKYNLVYKIGEAGYGKNAHTLGKPDNGQLTITITIDDDYVRQATQLALARTLIHESLHAFLVYTFQDHRFSDTSVLIDKYKDQHGSLGMAHHVFMTQYVDAVAMSLAAWDGHRLSMDYYNDLAWSGDMQRTEAFNKLSEDKKTSIQLANRVEGNALTAATNAALGEKCN